MTIVVNKDTKVHPLVRWQYRGGLRDSQEMGFQLENVLDAKKGGGEFKYFRYLGDGWLYTICYRFGQ